MQGLIKVANQIDALRQHDISGYTTSRCGEHAELNRYSNVYTYDHAWPADAPYICAAIIPECPLFKSNGCGGGIAAQAPVPAAMANFVEALWQQAVGLIVNLTPLTEKGMVKSHQYWPTAESPVMSFGGAYSLEHISTARLRIVSLEVDVHIMRCNEKPVQMLHVKTWPDHGTLGIEQLEALCRELDRYVRNHVEKKVLFHCSAGIGRTGTLLSAHMMYQARQLLSTIPLRDVPFQLLLHLRNYRPGMIQTAEQLASLFHFYDHLLEKQHEESKR